MSVETGFAVVGLGMGKHHCKAIDSAPNATLVAVCDVDGGVPSVWVPDIQRDR